MSTAPSAASAALTASAPAAGCVKSAIAYPAAPISRAASAVRVLVPVMNTSAPRARSWEATARPMPLEAAVTSACRPASGQPVL